MSIFQEWEKAKPHLEAALPYSRGTHTMDDVCLMVGAGIYKLLVGEDCAMCLEFVQTPRLKMASVFLAGGNLDGLLKMEDRLIQFAKDNGCTRIADLGREGWAKVLPGVRKVGCVLHRDIA